MSDFDLTKPLSLTLSEPLERKAKFDYSQHTFSSDPKLERQASLTAYINTFTQLLADWHEKYLGKTRVFKRRHTASSLELIERLSTFYLAEAQLKLALLRKDLDTAQEIFIQQTKKSIKEQDAPQLSFLKHLNTSRNYENCNFFFDFGGQNIILENLDQNLKEELIFTAHPKYNHYQNLPASIISSVELDLNPLAYYAQDLEAIEFLLTQGVEFQTAIVDPSNYPKKHSALDRWLQEGNFEAAQYLCERLSPHAGSFINELLHSQTSAFESLISYARTNRNISPVEERLLLRCFEALVENNSALTPTGEKKEKLDVNRWLSNGYAALNWLAHNTHYPPLILDFLLQQGAQAHNFNLSIKGTYTNATPLAKHLKLGNRAVIDAIFHNKNYPFLETLTQRFSTAEDLDKFKQNLTRYPTDKTQKFWAEYFILQEQKLLERQLGDFITERDTQTVSLSEPGAERPKNKI